MSVIVVMIDDQPTSAGVQRKMGELRSIIADSEFWFLVPKAVPPSVEQAFLDAGHHLMCYAPEDGSLPSVEGFVRWCDQQLRPIMPYAAAVFCDWQLKISPTAEHWEYENADAPSQAATHRPLLRSLFSRKPKSVDDLRGMKDLFERLNRLNPLTKWVFLTNHPKRFQPAGFVVYEKAAELTENDAYAIRDSASQIASRECDIEVYLAWLDRNHFPGSESLKHLSRNSRDWPKACWTCKQYVRPIAFVLGRGSGVLPTCVLTPDCQKDTPTVWEHFHRNLLLFLNPDWHILRFLVERFEETSYSFDLQASSVGGGGKFYRFSPIPDAITVKGSDREFRICLDSSIRADEVLGERNDVNVAGRHYGDDSFCCVLPSYAEAIAGVITENMLNIDYGNLCLYVHSQVDPAKSRYHVTFEHFCTYSRGHSGDLKLKGLAPQMIGPDIEYTARYVDAETAGRCPTASICERRTGRFDLTVSFPICRFADTENPWPSER